MVGQLNGAELLAKVRGSSASDHLSPVSGSLGLVHAEEPGAHGGGLLELATALASGLGFSGEAVLSVPFDNHDAPGHAFRFVFTGLPGTGAGRVVVTAELLFLGILTSTLVGSSGILVADHSREDDALPDGVLFGAFLHLGVGSFIGKNPGSDEFFRVAEVPALGSDVVEPFSVVVTAETEDAVLVGLSGRESEASHAVEEFKVAFGEDEFDFSGSEGVRPDDEFTPLVKVFVGMLLLDLDFLSVDENLGVVASDRLDVDEDVKVVGVSNRVDQNFFGFSGDLLGENGNFVSSD